ncbi:hypothetical protein ACP275_14G083500 [Erythranthe tilingii]
MLLLRHPDKLLLIFNQQQQHPKQSPPINPPLSPFSPETSILPDQNAAVYSPAGATPLTSLSPSCRAHFNFIAFHNNRRAVARGGDFRCGVRGMALVMGGGGGCRMREWRWRSLSGGSSLHLKCRGVSANFMYISFSCFRRRKMGNLVPTP